MKQKAYHTPFAPISRLSRNAAGMIRTTYRSSEIYREGVPFPSPSRAPQQVTETADTMKPRLMMCRAVTPIQTVSVLAVNNPIRLSGISQESIVPMTMTPAVSARVVWKIFFTRVFSPAP